MLPLVSHSTELQVLRVVMLPQMSQCMELRVPSHTRFSMEVRVVLPLMLARSSVGVAGTDASPKRPASGGGARRCPEDRIGCEACPFLDSGASATLTPTYPGLSRR